MPSSRNFDGAAASAFNGTVGSDIKALVIWTKLSFGHLASP